MFYEMNYRQIGISRKQKYEVEGRNHAEFQKCF